MKAVYFPRKGETAIGDLPDPVAGPGEVLVRVCASGHCHTDLEVMRGNYGRGVYPIIPGHEFTGEIVEIGPDVATLKTGDRVVVDPNIECGTCRSCRRGWAHLCEMLGAYGVTAHGGFAEMCAVRADAVHPIGDMSFISAALAEPVGCVLNGLSPLQDRLIERAAIFGTGPMGLLIGLALKARGTPGVIMLDLDDARLQLARDVGLDAMQANSAAEKELHRTCDLAVDATGVPRVAAGLTHHVANGGAALFFGVCPQDARIEISPFEVFRRQLTLFGTHSLNHNIPDALTVIGAIGPVIETVVTHRLPMDEVAAILSGHALPGSMKVQMVI